VAEAAGCWEVVDWAVVVVEPKMAEGERSKFGAPEVVHHKPCLLVLSDEAERELSKFGYPKVVDHKPCPFVLSDVKEGELSSKFGAPEVVVHK
jgi:hypothetical protein